ncbi:MAG: helix-turn-helix domain-containing protein [Proteobacteria bacterium]|nr:helix-turn-helix domain-containing protein [Pseudomonadota bacterium]
MTENLKSASSAKIGKVFKVARKELGLSKVEVSNAAFMNIRYINAIESGDYSIFPSEGFAKAYFIKYQDFLSIECEFPPIYESNNRQDEIIKKSIAKINPSFIPIIRVVVIVFTIFLSLYIINVSFSTETKDNDSSLVKETIPNNELNKIDEAVNLNNLTETPVNLIEDKPIINLSNKLIFSFFDECWIEIYSYDELIINKLFKYGDSFEVEIERPFKIVVGNAEAIEASYNGNNIDFITNANRLNVSTIMFNDE